MLAARIYASLECWAEIINVSCVQWLNQGQWYTYDFERLEHGIAVEVTAEESDPHEGCLLRYGRFCSFDDASCLVFALHMRLVSVVSYIISKWSCITYVHVRHEITLTSKFLASGESMKDKMLESWNLVSRRSDVDNLLLFPLGGILWSRIKQVLENVSDPKDRNRVLWSQCVSNKHWRNGFGLSNVPQMLASVKRRRRSLQ